ncbi:MAG: DUF4340 domain-containing protein [SAR324 cluster bacterium]|uniref:DUF4340 domain-containing protein n=1 Tax=SAR324 cluster bacterium TaxID=2024889 RepID=A0A7X9FRN5_9DELT|nr:DUF4340 domain-containing protein [SAR324 cluster bacterium]
MTGKKMLVLLLILLGVLAYIFLYEIPKSKEKETADLLLKGIKEEQIQRIEITKGDRRVSLLNKNYKPEVTFGKEDKEKDSVSKNSVWELGNKAGAVLDTSLVQSLSTALLDLKLDTAIPKDELDSDLGVYGLQNPEMTIKIAYAKGELDLRLGKKNDYVFKRYFQVSGKEGVYLISDSLFTAADKNELDFRKKNLVSFSDFEVKKLNVSKGSLKLVFEKQGDEGWRIVDPIQATGSSEKISALLREVRDYKAEDFIDFLQNEADSVLKQNRLDLPDLSVRIERAEGADVVQLLASEVQDLADASKKTTVFRVDQLPFLGKINRSVISRISMNPIDYREKKLFSYGSDVIKKAEIERAGQEKLVLELEKEDWKLGSEKADQAFVQQFYKNLSDLAAISFADEAQSKNFGFDTPTLKITLWTNKFESDEKPTPISLVVGAETENGYYAFAKDPKEVFVISKEALKNISPSRETLLPVKTEPTVTVSVSPN